MATAGSQGELLLREAIEVLDGPDTRLEQGRVEADLGARLRRGNRRVEAREPTDRAEPVRQRRHCGDPSQQGVQRAADLEETSGDAVAITVTDITDGDSVDAWVGAVLVSLGERGLDVLLTAERVRTPSATPALVKAFLPSLRMAGGRIVQIGRTTRVAPLPPGGASDATVTTPAAIAQLSRSTLEPVGIEVVTVHLDGAGETESSATAAPRVIEVVDGGR